RVAKDPLDVHMVRGLNYGLIVGVIFDLVRAGKVAAALRLFGAWYELPEEVARRDAVVVALRGEQVVWWAKEGKVLKAEGDQRAALETLNRVLGVSLVD